MNSSSGLPDTIFVGPPKTASTWIYECLHDHPQISVPENDNIDYFSANYHRDIDWYLSELGDSSIGSVVDMSQGYFQSIKAPSRIVDTVPDADIVITIRNPMDRAFSHWWHGRGSKYHEYNFENIFNDYSKFVWWARPGFYYEHTSRFLDCFPDDQIHIVFFEDLVEDDYEFIQNIFEIIDVDSDYVPEQVDEKSNTANRDAPAVWVRLRNWLRSNAPPKSKTILEPLYHGTKYFVESESEYDRGMNPELRRQLEQVYIEDVRALSSLTGRDFNHWFEYIEV